MNLNFKMNLLQNNCFNTIKYTFVHIYIYVYTQPSKSC